MTTANKTKWGEVLAGYTESFNEICGILSEDGSAVQVTHNDGGYAIGVDNGTVADQLTEKELDGVIKALWLLAESSPKCRAIASTIVLNH